MTFDATQHAAPAIIVLNQSGLNTARRVQEVFLNAHIYGLQGRVIGADTAFDNFGDTVRALYQRNTPLIALCAAGIIIRTLAPALQEKGNEPPVLAVAEDGSAVVPLLGGISGVNALARHLGNTLAVAPAITTSGELRFGTCLLNPPFGYVLDDIEQGKRFVSDLLAGERVHIEGDAPWLHSANLTLDNNARHCIYVTPALRSPCQEELLIHPRCVVIAVKDPDAGLTEKLQRALYDAGLAEKAIACIVAENRHMAHAELQHVSALLNVPLRFFGKAQHLDAQAFVAQALPHTVKTVLADEHLAIAIAAMPVDIATIGQARGSLTVIGLGPGAAELMIPATRRALDDADDLLGYETYINMAGPFKPHQVLHCTDNREEMQRARHAFELAAQGRKVVVVSSGDPGVFAMAAAVLEALHQASDASEWHQVALHIIPGVTAAMATAARAGAPLGHDFCLISLSDNLKPWDVIEKRLALAAEADFVLAFYNPISKARPWQLSRAIEIVAGHRTPETVVVLGRDIGRPGETLATTTLGELHPQQVDMRTMVIIGSSKTCRFPRADGGDWVYTPRWY